MSREVRIVGTRSFAAEVADFARDAGLDVKGLLEPRDPARVGETVHGLRVGALEEGPAEGPEVLIATGDFDRREIVARAESAGWRPVPLVHPRAHVASSAMVGEGVLVGPGVVVGAEATIGEHAVLGRGALVGHHTSIAAFSTLGPGANVAGNTRVGAGALLGMGCVVRDHLTVGERAVIAMGAVVVADVSPGAEVRGVPARSRGAGDA